MRKIDEIGKVYNTGKYDQQEIAEMFNVGQPCISSICRGSTWSRVTGIRK